MYRRLAFRKGAASAKVAVARKLAIRLYIMLRDRIDTRSFVGEVRMPGCSGMWRWSNHDRNSD